MSELNKNELNDEELEGVAGGRISDEEWLAMTAEERQKAKDDSYRIRYVENSSEYCAYYDDAPGAI